MSDSMIAWTPVPHVRVTVDDAFWSPRLAVNRERTIPYEYGQLVETGHLDALGVTWRPGQEKEPVFGWESDIAKWLEAACYSVATHPDPALQSRIDESVRLLAAAQQPDGYLNPYITIVESDVRWRDLRNSHELYCAGHIMEAGVAHYYATGQRDLLDVACRLADMIDRTFGCEPDQKRGYCGHPEIELALVKLAHATGEQRYLRLSQYFVDERGHEPNILAQEPGPHYLDFWYKQQRKAWTPEFCQSQRPVREQSEIVGHGVRAMYLYCGMADLALDAGDQELRMACRRIWDNLCNTRLYITGGVGPSAQNEGFTTDYDLPNETAYCETCAAVGLVFWAHRLAHLEHDGRYIDILERALYNGVLSGISVDGERFFYVNALASRGNRHRQSWFGTACCPPNVARLLASLGGYVYSQSPTDAIVHLYVGGTGRLNVGGQTVVIYQQTMYPWDGQVTLRLELAEPHTFTLRLRVPGWCAQASIDIDGATLDAVEHSEQGYICIRRHWHNQRNRAPGLFHASRTNLRASSSGRRRGMCGASAGPARLLY